MKRLSAADLKGAPMSILWVLHEAHQLDGITCLTTGQLCARARWGKQAIRDALCQLGDAGYVVSTGTQGQGGERVWMLSHLAPRLMPLPPATLGGPATQSEKSPALPARLPATQSEKSPAYAHAGDFSDCVAPEIESVKDLTTSISTDSPAQIAERALAAGGVFPNIRRKLSANLPPAYLPHLLGHLARAKRGDHPGYNLPAVYLKDQAETGTPVATADLPPADLALGAALAWALNGGQTAAQIAAAELAAAELAARDAQADLESAAELAAAELAQAQARAAAAAQAAAAAAAAQPYQALWQTVLGQLALEMSRSVFETWLADSRLVLIDDAGVHHIAVPTPAAQAWLSHSLAGPIRRHLAAHSPLTELRFVVQPRASPP